MRTTPLVGKKAWFGPRKHGWGLSPSSPEGWVVTGAALGAGVWLARRFPDRPVLSRLPGIALVAASILKGTAPGGPKAFARLHGPAQSAR